MAENGFRDELSARTLKELKVIASHLGIAHAGTTKAELVEKILQGDQQRLQYMFGPLHYDPNNTELVLSMIEPWRWRSRFTFFLGAFGAFWLLLGPIATFTTGSRILSHLGWWAYLLMVISSMIVTGISEKQEKKLQMKSQDLVTFFIVYIKSGRRITIRAPLDMQIEGFLRAFVMRLKDLFPVDCAAIHLYKNNLLIETKKGFKPLDSSLTLREAGIVDGSVCRLRGYIRVEYQRPLMDIEYSWQGTRLALARARGIVILDEEDSICACPLG